MRRARTALAAALALGSAAAVPCNGSPIPPESWLCDAPTGMTTLEDLACDGLDPMQVLKTDSGWALYEMSYRNTSVNAMPKKLYDLPDNIMNAFAISHSVADSGVAGGDLVVSIPLVAVTPQIGTGTGLCTFDDTGVLCAPSLTLSVDKPKAATIVGDTYFYAIGDWAGKPDVSIYAVKSVLSGAPELVDPAVLIEADKVAGLMTGGVYDFTYIVEDAANPYLVADDVDMGTYIVGMAERPFGPPYKAFSLFIGVINDDMQLYQYAVTKTEIVDESLPSWFEKPAADATTKYGSAYTQDNFFGTATPQVFFEANSNSAGADEPESFLGTFQLQLSTKPLDETEFGDLRVRSDCWNTAANVGSHAECLTTGQGTDDRFRTTVNLHWVGQSPKSDNNDGAACRLYADPTAEPTTATPSTSPEPTVSAAPTMSRAPIADPGPPATDEPTPAPTPCDECFTGHGNDDCELGYTCVAKQQARLRRALRFYVHPDGCCVADARRA